MANIDEGTVLGGRYEITGRVMASAQQDLVLTGLDQVLNREVLILVASRENASQAAQSARQLATGERTSTIQILDLGLSDDRTYLVAPGNSDVEDFLALLTSEDVYVEPFFTEHLGTELFGEARQRTPETFDDDVEYYRELQDDIAEEQEAPKRPEFINRLSDRIDHWLQEDTDQRPIGPGPAPQGGRSGATAAGAAGAAAGASAAEQNRQREPEVEDQPQPSPAEEPAEPQQHPEQPAAPAAETPPKQQTPPEEASRPEAADEERTEVFPPVTAEQSPPPAPHQAPTPVPPPPPPPLEVEPARQELIQQEPGSQEAIHQAPAQQAQAKQRVPQRPTPLTPSPEEPAADDGYAIEYTDEKPRSAVGRWFGGIFLVAILVFAVVIGFRVLGSPEDEPPVATEPTAGAPAEDEEEAPAEEEDPEEEESEGPDPVPASVERVVPSAPQLSNEYDADLPAIIDGNQATAWHTLTFTTPQFGNLASNLALVVELEEQAPISEITIHQNQGSGGAFTVAASNEPDPEGGVMITEGSFTGPEYTVDAHDSDGEPIEARYVIINFTELPTLSNTNSPDRPYGLRIAEIEVN